MKHITHKTTYLICSMFHVPCSMKRRGFSLLEMTVMLAVFLVIMGIATSLLISMIGQQRRMLAEQELTNQSLYATEFMATALKSATEASSESSCLGEGQIYLLTPAGCAGSGEICSGVQFINGSNEDTCDRFFLDTTDPGNPVVKYSQDGETAQALMSGKFPIEYLRFVINGDKTKQSASADLVQPRITMVLKVKTQESAGNQQKILQSTISRKELVQ